jgi:GNAT superfamily N-acetyltransferase
VRLEIVRYDESRRDQVLSLQRHLWGGDDALNRRILDWRYGAHPLADRPWLYLLLVDDEPAGMRGFLPSSWEHGAGSETTTLLSACDLVLDPKHQGKGLVRHLMDGALRDLALEGHRFVLSFSANPATSLLQQRQGWKQVVDYEWLGVQSPRIARLRRARGALARRQLGQRIGSRLSGRLAGHALGVLERPGADEVELAPGIRTSDQPRPREMAALMGGGARHDPSRLHAAPGEGELEWRFGNPQRRYRFLFCEAEGRLLGFLALSARGAHDFDVVIVECRAVSAAIEAHLLEALVRAGRVPRLATWSAGLAEATLASLRALGFSAFDQTPAVGRYRPGFLVRPTANHLDPESWRLFGRDLRQAESWDLRPLSSDAY